MYLKKKILIIGSGWYRCHIASILKDKHDIIIIEKTKIYLVVHHILIKIDCV